MRSTIQRCWPNRAFDSTPLRLAVSGPPHTTCDRRGASLAPRRSCALGARQEQGGGYGSTTSAVVAPPVDTVTPSTTACLFAEPAGGRTRSA